MPEPTEPKPKPRYPLLMHKAQGGKIVSGHIHNAEHEAAATANGWFEEQADAEAAQSPPPAAQPTLSPTVEERLTELERWMAEEKQRRSQ